MKKWIMIIALLATSAGIYFVVIPGSDNLVNTGNIGTEADGHVTHLPDLNPLLRKQADKEEAQAIASIQDPEQLKQQMKVHEVEIDKLIARMNENLDNPSERKRIEQELNTVSAQYKSLTLAHVKSRLQKEAHAKQE